MSTIVTLKKLDGQYAAVCRVDGTIRQIIASDNEAQVSVCVEWHYPGAEYVTPVTWA